MKTGKKMGFYPRLAWSGISKNRKTYVPYLLTCIGMVMMFYIVAFLSVNQSVKEMPRGENMQMVLALGKGVIGVFSLIFLFYTNSFLIRRRKTEFGLYNILGMGKQSLGRILVWESLMIGGISLVCGLVCGILFSKLAELFVAWMLHANVGFAFSVEIKEVVITIILFAVIFFLILLRTLREVHVSKPVELLHGEMVGEKPPKANWLVALLGVAVLGAAYYLALNVKDPASALFWFFVAVILVIIATYLLFVAGSVAPCRLLQKNKNYYYQTNHFISISSMTYRMKRNGAGLASICILSTMVLVMISSTACLYIGAEDSLRTRYPRDIVVDTYSFEPEYVEQVDQIIETALQKNNLNAENVLQYRYLDVAGCLAGDRITFERPDRRGVQLSVHEQLVQLFFVPIGDYNRMMGKQETLKDDEVFLYASKMKYIEESIRIHDIPTMRVKILPEFVDHGIDAMQMIPSLFIIVPDLSVIQEVSAEQAAVYGRNQSYLHTYYGFDLSLDDSAIIDVFDGISGELNQLINNASEFPRIGRECIARERQNFYSLYGGLFFLGILLGIVFIFAAVLIMYYKQISEGYEDRSRFMIMQKVGLTKREIKKSINSQLLTVFFLPLVTAGVHLTFAFPMIALLLRIFNLTNTGLLAAVMAGCYVIFAVLYVLVYRITSGAYYSIVSGAQGE